MNTQSTPMLVVTVDGARITLREKETNAPCAEMWLGSGGADAAREAAFAIANACNAHDELVARCEDADRQHAHRMHVMLDIRDELVAALEDMVAWANFRSDWTPGEEPTDHPITKARAALAKAGAL